MAPVRSRTQRKSTPTQATVTRTSEWNPMFPHNWITAKLKIELTKRNLSFAQNDKHAALVRQYVEAQQRYNCRGNDNVMQQSPATVSSPPDYPDRTEVRKHSPRRATSVSRSHNDISINTLASTMESLASTVNYFIQNVQNLTSNVALLYERWSTDSGIINQTSQPSYGNIGGNNTSERPHGVTSRYP